MHIVTLYSWALYRIYFTTEEHSGFDFPWHLNKCIPYGVSSDHHNFHHEKNIGNYGQFTIFWDYIFGTEEVYNERKLKQN